MCGEVFPVFFGGAVVLFINVVNVVNVINVINVVNGGMGRFELEFKKASTAISGGTLKRYGSLRLCCAAGLGAGKRAVV